MTTRPGEAQESNSADLKVFRSGARQFWKKTNRKPQRAAHSDDLCDFCKSLDVDPFIVPQASWYPASPEYPVVVSSKEYLPLAKEHCRLCKVFVAAWDEVRPDPSSPKKPRLKGDIRAFSYLQSGHPFPNNPYGFREQDPVWHLDTLMLAATPTPIISPSPKFSGPGHEIFSFIRAQVQYYTENKGSLICQNVSPIAQSGVFIFRPVLQQPDVSQINSWMNRCKRHHQGKCISTNEDVFDLKVLDCHTLAVIPAPHHCSYVALSYVWGPPSNCTAKPTLPNDAPFAFPQAIQDAIKFTSGLGFNYLWVDKYCIDQMDESSKHIQIQQMHLIYQNAEVTIVAAAGSDENAGLPGVGVPRKTQPFARVGRKEFMFTLRQPQQVIRDSIWCSRGWTFQEAVLSRRLLIFTEDQVYFECAEMTCSESVTPNVDAVPEGLRPRFCQSLSSGLFWGSDFAAPGGRSESSLRQFRQAVRDYSRRTLTYEEDTLNAFSGIAKQFKLVDPPVVHVFGLPIQNVDLLAYEFVISLLWFQPGSAKNVRRQTGFPSWTWVGWKGSILFVDMSLTTFQQSVQISTIELTDGTNIDLRELYERSLSKRANLSSPIALRLDAHILDPAGFTGLRSDGRTILYGGYGVYVSPEPKMMELGRIFEDLKGGILHCMAMGDTSSVLNEVDSLFTLVIRVEDTSRLGMSSFSDAHRVCRLVIENLPSATAIFRGNQLDRFSHFPAKVRLI
ncbi:HET-domain-containing protein [Amniculicola lignicola CBS 123094]|uniref:HET-domain-containing protein n=1 Tax=Amniculicola lignicola CBS 123094 TaxID=1392246 RepID=A0A6A5WUZ3_9PLEO|nr:HET-domain-containing protein [Amniculicola lignicola CBS 123094]